MAMMLGIVANAVTAASGLLPLIADDIGLLPFISPAIKEDMWRITALLAVLAGIVTYQAVVFLGPRGPIKWVARLFGVIICGGLVVAFASLVLMILTWSEVFLAEKPAGAIAAVMISYASCFVGVSSAVGAAIGLWRVR